MKLYETAIAARQARQDTWIGDNLILFKYVVLSGKYPTLRAQASRLEELGIPTVRGYRHWDKRTLFRWTKKLRDGGYLE